MFRQCSQFHSLRYASIILLSSSVLFQSFLLNIIHVLIYSSVKCFPESYFSIPLSFYFDEKIRLVVITTPQWLTCFDIINIPSVSEALSPTRSRPWLFLTHVE